jgi:hypothetical protein
MKIDNTLIAISALAILEILALMKGIDGQLFATVISLIAGLGGYELGKRKKKR